MQNLPLTFLRALVAVALMGVGCATNAADVYRWTDANGRVHYGDVPPVSSKPLDVPGANKAEKAEKQKESEAMVCQQARDNLNTYAAATQIKQTDPVTGQLRDVTPEERQKMIDSEAAKIGQHCNVQKASPGPGAGSPIDSMAPSVQMPPAAATQPTAPKS